jgi:hypothetical protein
MALLRGFQGPTEVSTYAMEIGGSSKEDARSTTFRAQAFKSETTQEFLLIYSTHQGSQ